jgi:hypothetical protein
MYKFSTISFSLSLISEIILPYGLTIKDDPEYSIELPKPIQL